MKPAAHVRSSVTADGVLLMDVRTGQIFSANAIAARIWSSLQQEVPLAEIVARIAADTGADRAAVERDAADFVATLRAHSLVAEG